MLLIKMFHLNLENVPSRRTAMTDVDSSNKKKQNNRCKIQDCLK